MMKHVNFSKKVVVIACTLALFSCLLFPVSAASVSYDDVSEKMVFDTKGATPTDLFENFKEVMPGDVLTQEVTLKNPATNRVKIKLYLRSLGADEGSEAVLSQMQLSVKQTDGSLLFDAPADQKATLADWVYLGTVYAGGDIKLMLTLTVPITVGNELQDAVGTLRWEFKTDELAIDTAEKRCDNCNHIMEIVEKDGYAIHVCEHCHAEEEMHCPVCGKKMVKVVKRGEDGKYYIYYECVDIPGHYHTDPSPVTGDPWNVALWVLIAGVACTGTLILFIIPAKKRKKAAENR